MEHKIVAVRLDKELNEWVIEQTKRWHCTMSQIIRNLITEKIENEKRKNEN
jgi:hypothetical protein